MQPHQIVSRQEWIEARKAHMAREKELIRARDRLSEERRQLPWVKVDKAYAFDGPSGKVTLDPATHHSIFDVHLAVFKDKKMNLLETFPQRKPADTAAVCDLKKNPREVKQYIIKVN